MRPVASLLAAFSTFLACTASAHHSFAVYDIDNKIERTGRLSQIAFSSPHIQFVLEVENAEGGKETWQIESMSPGRWDQAGIPRDVVGIGDEVTILGWPARNGSDEMVLSTIVTARGRTVVIEEICQRSAREAVPDVTIRRE
jgi:hypothetical protein